MNLQLEDYPAAYTAMTSNTDKDRRKDCLRNFVLHLSEKGDLAPLVEAPYGGLEEEISSILENRALAVSGNFFRGFIFLDFHSIFSARYEIFRFIICFPHNEREFSTGCKEYVFTCNTSESRKR